MLLANTAPSDSADVVAEELAKMVADGSIVRQLGAFVRPEDLTATAVHPVYVFRLDELNDGFKTANTSPTTWRYLLELNKRIVASIETSVYNGRHIFGNVSTGPFVDGTANAILFADTLTAADPYRFGVVHVPALHTMLLWLQSESPGADQFFAIAPAPRSLQVQRTYTADAIARELEASARQSLTEQQPGSPDGADKGA